MSRNHYQFRLENTQRLADARGGKVSYNIIRKQPYMASQSTPSVQEETFVSESSIENKPFDLYEFLRETERLSYDSIQESMNVNYGKRKR